jgi:hypothetical protein
MEDECTAVEDLSPICLVGFHLHFSFDVLIRFVRIKSFWSTDFYKELIKNNRGVELNNCGTLKSTVELLKQLWKWAIQLWNLKIHCGQINCGGIRMQCGQLWTSCSLFNSSTNHTTVELWKNIS